MRLLILRFNARFLVVILLFSIISLAPNVIPQVFAAGPDFIVEKIYLDNPNVQPAQKTKIWTVVKNVGDTKTNDSHIAFYINNVLFDEVSIGDKHPDGTATESTKLWEYPGGTVTIKVCADPQNTTSESNESNNCSSITVGGITEKISTTLDISICPSTGSGYDCTVSSISKNSDVQIKIQGMLKNTNQDGISGKNIQLSWPGGLTSVTTSSSGGYDYTVTVNLSESGIFSVSFTGDDTYKSSSNSKTISTISPPSPPSPSEKSDLVIEQVYLGTPNVAVGSKTKIWTSVKNIGNAKSQPSYVSWSIDGNFFHEAFVGDTHSGSGTTLDSKFWEYLGGSHIILVCADSKNSNAESNENNNCMSIQYSSGPATASISPTSITITINPSSIKENTPTSVTISGKLKSDSGSGVGGKSIQISLYGNTATAISDSTGFYQYTFSQLKMPKGSWNIETRFFGDGSYKESVTTSLLVVSSTPTPAPLPTPTPPPPTSLPSLEDIAKNSQRSGESFKIFKIIGDPSENYIVVYWKDNQNIPTSTLAIDSKGNTVNLDASRYNVPAVLIFYGINDQNDIDNKIAFWNSYTERFKDDANQIRQEHDTFKKVHVIVTGLQIGSLWAPSPIHLKGIYEILHILAEAGLDFMDQKSLGDIHDLFLKIQDERNVISDLANDNSYQWSRLSENGGDFDAATALVPAKNDKKILDMNIKQIENIIKIVEIGQETTIGQFDIFCPENAILKMLPEWYKENTIRFWVGGTISEREFRDSLDYLTSNNIIPVTNPRQIVCDLINDPSVLFNSVEQEKVTLRNVVQQYQNEISNMERFESNFQDLFAKLVSQQRNMIIK